MKSPKTLIREREAAMPPAKNSVRIYGYVRPHRTGEATVEFWGARRNRKGRLVCKKFFVFRTDSDYYRTKDTLQYNSWSSLCPDHICYSFPEADGTDYHLRAESQCGGEWQDLKGEWLTDKVSTTRKGHLPRFHPFLNGFEGTKYKYCGFDWRSGFFFTDYIQLWRKFPKDEILSKMGCYQLLTERFLKRLDADKPFAKYVCRYNDAIRRHAMKPMEIYSAFKAQTDLTRYVQELEQRRRAAEAAELERVRRELAENDERIFALYERLKDICAAHGAYEVIVPKSAAEMLEEGEAMHNCIGKCYARRQGREDLCLFIHKDGKPCVDIRIDLATFKLVECREVCNKDASEAHWQFAREVAEMVRVRLAA
jgi:hypothetical protein